MSAEGSRVRTRSRSVNKKDCQVVEIEAFHRIFQVFFRNMKNTADKESNSDSESSLPPKVFELVGEPAIVINGVPDIAIPNDAESQTNEKQPGITAFNLGEWLEGREVKKLFGEHYYLGKVTKCDLETGWYRVLYEDGDSEDLDWNELEEVLLPLDITVPLKSLALKIIKKTQKLSGTAVGSPWNAKAKWSKANEE